MKRECYRKRKESKSGRERTSEKENRIKESESNKDTVNEVYMYS